MARNTQQKPAIGEETIDLALAKAVADGDLVVLKQLFGPASPLRAWTTENIYSPKYAYMLPDEDEENSPLFRDALDVVHNPAVAKHARQQLATDGPAQLHAALVLALADSGVRVGKYSSAAQAYELLRIRPRIREEFFRQGDAALDADDVATAAYAYIVATGLAYNYAAFPEPLPMVPDYQSRALILHADYPSAPENCVALQAPDQFIKTALTYLLLDAEAAARFDGRPLSLRAALAVEIVRRHDAQWAAFVDRYHEACALVSEFGRRLQRQANREEGATAALEEEIAAQDQASGAREIPARLLGRVMPEGAWWQYLKELAYEHPAAALFVVRQAVGNDVEIIMPRFREDCPLLQPLGLQPAPV